jgi:hypothetical protein
LTSPILNSGLLSKEKNRNEKFDISDPEQIQRVGMHWDGEWNDKARFTGRGKFLYVTTYGGITIIDVSNPAQPVRIGTFPDAFQHSMISLFGDHAYVLTADFPEGGCLHAICGASMISQRQVTPSW